MPDSAFASGFTDAPLESQAVFRACMAALSRPATLQPLAAGVAPPAPLTPELAAVALALADHEAPLWLDAALAAEPAVRRYLAFHTGARFVADPADAAFALIAEARHCPAFAVFAAGSDEYPDRSTTLVIAVDRLSTGTDLVFSGPGIKGRAGLAAAPLPADFEAELAANHASFPRGIDLFLVSDGIVAALPRSSKLIGEA
ncbi:phosphonate C-P lyase system protein PhnH [Labrys monachus]|uniref:Alpha-D-ribose 1-methylphosphonate 5-triphosphate synthase subunit PhnH n=1 Tax=Labrys monachus TaxID=217067 RepID=A0ABU0FJ90_9HYPH|nr:phosphonate C-P lyase system protein PhnH [Labrys monachus]MDQ0394673.1 alpha-D-ribose 1-methylphosphonate 5-triphosphate synthase subunit PhnH [Labrys monachus]